MLIDAPSYEYDKAGSKKKEQKAKPFMDFINSIPR